MTYDLSKYRLQPGDPVEVHNGRFAISRHFVDSKLVAEWNYDKGNRGKVVRLWQPHPRSNVPPRIVVEPLPEFGHGEHTFAAKWCI